MKRILIIKLWALGDMMMATPMLTALRAQDPAVTIAWLADREYADLLSNHPDIDEVIPLDTGEWRRLRRRGNLPGWVRRTATLRAEMRARRFDVVINCHPEMWWSWFLCAAPARLALYPSSEMPYRRFYTHPVAGVPGHNTEHYLAAPRALGCPVADKRMTIGQTAEELPYWAAFQQEHRIQPGEPVVALAPFTTSDNRVWESDRLAQVADWLHADYKARVILLAAAKESAQARRIVELMQTRHPIIAQGTTLRQYIALLRAADLVICGDSSPMHLAAALGTPYVALFGPTPVAARAPLVGQGIALAKALPCAPCDQNSCRNSIFRECLKLITVSDVQSAVRELLAVKAA